MECEMSIDELALTTPGEITKVASTAPALPAHAGLAEKLPPAIYAGDRQDRIDQHVGIGEVDAEGKVLRVNAQSCTFTGYSPDEILGCSIFDETHDGDVEADREQFRRQVAGQLDRYTVEKRIRRKDGSFVWASITSLSVRDADGRFLYALRILNDLTERRRVEDALAARSRELTALYQFTDRLRRAGSLDEVYEPALDAILGALQCSRAAILLRDSSGVMRFVASRGLSDPYRRAVDGVSPWHPDVKDAEPICVDDVALAAFPEPLKRVVIGEGIRALAFIPLLLAGRLTGKFMAYYDGPHAFPRPEIDLAVTIARQLGSSIERIRTERALRESEARKSAILQSALDAVITMDQEGRIVDFNPAAEELLRCRREQVLGRTVAETMIPERFREKHQQGLKRFLETGQSSIIGRRFEIAALRADGGEFEAEIAVSSSSLEGGQTLFTAYLRDVTAQKKRAEQAETQQRVLLGELNHRVKNNMQMLQSLLGVAARQAASAEAREVLEEASGRISAMAAAQRVLYTTPDAMRFSARDFLNTVCETAKQTFPQELAIDCEADSIQLSNDAAIPLALIVNELLTNAVKHGLNGRHAGTIRVRLTRENDSFLFYVEDDGPGFHLQSVQRRSSGLTLVQGLARQLRGEFEVTRTPATRCSVRFQ
jgi:PAS domain S-box-containing protein